MGVTVVEIGFVQTDMLDDLRSNDFVEGQFDRYKRLGLARIMAVDGRARRSPPQSRRNAATSDFRNARRDVDDRQRPRR